MCFINKMNCIRIRKREDCVPNPVRTPGRVLGRELLTNPACNEIFSINKELTIVCEVIINGDTAYEVDTHTHSVF